jgi:hypothetical protein
VTGNRDSSLPSSAFQTPIATQLFEPDEPLTATQEAVAVEGFEFPSPPPLFPEDPVSSGAPRDGPMASVHWAESTKAFFDLIDSRRLLDVDA